MVMLFWIVQYFSEKKHIATFCQHFWATGKENTEHDKLQNPLPQAKSCSSNTADAMRNTFCFSRVILVYLKIFLEEEDYL